MHNLTKISPEYLLQYVQGKLNESEKNALEKIAADEPLLADAIDGYILNPQPLIDIVEKRKKIQLKKSSILITIGILLTSASIFFLVNFNAQKEDVLLAENNRNNQITNDTLTEVEILPNFIDTLNVEPEPEIIKAKEVSVNKKEIQKTIKYQNEEGILPIVIEESIEIPTNYELIPEDDKLQIESQVPGTYLFDLFVVDYRRIEREKTEITYTKFELTGTPAKFEHNNQTEDLIETVVKVSYWEYLIKSMEFFAKENYKNALNRFLIILEQYPNDLNALFYAGISYYNLGSFNKSIELFDKLISNSLNAFKEEAAWYKVKSLIKLKRNHEAVNLLEDIISQGGFYTQDAIELRNKIK